MSGTRTKVTRLVAAVLFVLPAVVAAGSASAEPTQTSQDDVAQAEAAVAHTGHELELIIERYNEARYRLEQTQAKLDDAHRQMQEAQAELEATQARLASRAVEAYTGMGSQVDTLLAADDFTQFSDRLEFMGAIAQNDADLATLAAAAEQQAQWAADQYRKVVSDRRAKLAEMASTRDQIQSMLAEQQAELDQTRRDYADWQAFLEAQREQAAAAAAAEEAASNDTGGGTGGATGGDTGGGAGGGYVPPPNLTGAAAAVAAARSVLGTQYVWGAADPSVGFDCSGLTSWAWAQGGVYIPHSSASQYSSLPHVPSMAQAQPGDLLFFYSPISHVALYIGGGMMIHARHPGPGGQVQIGSVSGYGTPVVGIARPG